MGRRQLVMGLIVGAVVSLVGGLGWWGWSEGWVSPQGKAGQLLRQARRAAQRGDFADAQAKLEELVGASPDSPWTDDALLALGHVYQQQEQLVEARAVYRLFLERFPDSPLAGQAQGRLGAINVALLFSPAVTERAAAYEVKPGDTLTEIASAYHTTVELVKRANGLASDVIRPKQRLKVPVGTFSIVVDKSQNQLLLAENNQFFKAYPVATGANGSTPTGTFKIVNRITNPVWYRQGAVVPPDSPENILGTRWLGWDKSGYGIHGSTDLGSIGRQVTAGCVRMTNADVEELFAIVPQGTDVTVVD